jgi:MYXO-CTERM domain-containing protein
MMLKTARLSVLTLMLFAGTASGALAQAPGGGAGGAPNTSTTQNRNDDRHDWGWVGLLGLAGLAGLMGRRRDIRRDTTTTTGPGRGL